MFKNKLLLRTLLYSIIPFVPYLLGFYLAVIQEEIGGGLAIILIWSAVDIILALIGKDLHIIWEEIDES